MVQSSQELFFHEQDSFRPKTQRFRKTPEDLPQSLRFAHLNPKVAAYLAKQGASVGGDREERSPSTALQEMGNTALSLQAQLETALSSGAVAEESTDTSRILLDEGRAQAPLLLYQLARVLYRPQGTSQPHIPASLEWSLSQQWVQLTSEAQPVHREWQSAEQRQLALQQRLAASEDASRPASGSSDARGGRQSRARKPVLGNIAESPETLIARHSRARERVVEPQKSTLQVPRAASRGASQASRRGTMLGDKPHTGQTVPDQQRPASKLRSERGMSRKSSILETPSVFGDSMKSAMPQGYFVTNISFQLSSKLCDDKGWILHPKEHQAERERHQATALEQAFLHLQHARGQAEDLQQEELERGLDKPLSVRFYGDRTSEEINKYRKNRSLPTLTKGGKPRLPVTLMDETFTRKKICLAAYVDGGTAVFYPSGRLALLASPGGPLGSPAAAGSFTYCYDDTPHRRMIAFFTPNGRGSCFHSNGRAKLLCTERGVAVANEDGTVVEKYRWPPHGSRLSSTIHVQMNSSLSLKCVSQQGTQISFTCMRESFKFAIGPVPGLPIPKKEELGLLQTDCNFTSIAALDHLHPMVKKEKKKYRNKKAELAELRKSLQYESGAKYDIEADRELASLQTKVKIIVDGWLEHYRIHLGLLEQELEDILDETPVTSRERQISSAKQRPTSGGIDDQKIRVRAKTAPPTRQITAVTKESIPPPQPAPSEPPTALSPPKPAKSVSLSPGMLAALDQDESEPKEISIAIRTHPQSAGPTVGRRSAPVLGSNLSRPSTVPHQSLRVHSSNLLGCTVALRNSLLGSEQSTCHCSRHRIPAITDVELDVFLSRHVNASQIVVISVVSSLFPTALQCDDMLESIHAEQNRNRSRPCLAQHRDPYRLLRYDVATAAAMSDHTAPQLLTSHNVVPGMVLMYHDGKLLFCDHIFNGYGNARVDFFKQLHQCRSDAKRGFYLPKDFRFSPGRGLSGARSGWGGQIGGTGVDNFGAKGFSLESQAFNEGPGTPLSGGESIKTIQIALAGTGLIKEVNNRIVGENASQLIANSLATHDDTHIRLPRAQIQSAI